MKNIIYIIRCAYDALCHDAKLKRTVGTLWILYLSYYILSMLMPIFQSMMLDGAAALILGTGVASLIVGVVGIIAVSCFRSIYNCSVSFLSNIADTKISLHIQEQIYDKLCRISYSSFNSPKLYNDIDTVSGRFAEYCSRFLAGRTLSSVIGTAISFVFTTVILIRVHPLVAIVMIAGNLFGIFKTFLEARFDYYTVVGNMKERRHADAYEGVLFNRDYIKETRLFGLTDYICDKWLHHAHCVNRRTLRCNTLFSGLDFIVYGLSNAFTISALLLTAWLIQRGECSVGAFLLVYSSSGSLIDTSGSLFHSIKDLKLASYYADLHKRLESMPDVEPEDVGERKIDGDMNIEFRGVSFTYEGAESPALHNINLQIKQGEKVAIVGENGCGKTTLVSLLNRLYVPTEGEIFISNNQIGEVIGDMRQKCVTLFQDFGCYETSVRENLSMGDVCHDYSDDELLLAAEKSGIDEWISSLPNGLDTAIGRFEEDGINLSGGQWQKIAVARSMVRNDRKILVMDEPNASLDPISEAVIYKHVLANMTPNETLILISHRLGAVKYADRIIVMSGGEIIEEGTHESLMAIGGTYYEMYSAQEKWYG